MLNCQVIRIGHILSNGETKAQSQPVCEENQYIIYEKSEAQKQGVSAQDNTASLCATEPAVTQVPTSQPTLPPSQPTLPPTPPPEEAWGWE